MGERALVRVFEELRRDREGVHEARAGGLAEPTGATRPWRFGDAGQIAVQRSVFNAVVRGGPGARVRLEPDDLSSRGRAAHRGGDRVAAGPLVLPPRGHDVHAKDGPRPACIDRGRYPHDTLYLIGFSDYARRMQPRELAAAGWERVYGTNMHHAFHLAGRLLAQHPRATRQVIMVTDGEPTAHLEGMRASRGRRSPRRSA